MATHWTGVRDAVASIISGAAGTGRTVPASTFTSANLEAELLDAEQPPILAERLFELIPTRARQVSQPMENPLSGNNREQIALALRIAYRIDTGGSAYPSGTPGDSQTEAAALKAANDWHVIRRALLWPPNWTTSDGVTVVRIEPGEASFDPRPNGLLITTATLVVEVASDPTTARNLG